MIDPYILNIEGMSTILEIITLRDHVVVELHVGKIYFTCYTSKNRIHDQNCHIEVL